MNRRRKPMIYRWREQATNLLITWGKGSSSHWYDIKFSSIPFTFEYPLKIGHVVGFWRLKGFDIVCYMARANNITGCGNSQVTHPKVLYKHSYTKRPIPGICLFLLLQKENLESQIFLNKIAFHRSAAVEI